MIEEQRAKSSGGSPSFISIAGTMPPSSQEALDEAVAALAARKDAWIGVSAGERVALLDRLIEATHAMIPRLVDSAVRAKGTAGDEVALCEEWVQSGYVTMDNLRRLRVALADIAQGKPPRIPGPLRILPGGQVGAQVFPQLLGDRAFFTGISAEVWMEPGVSYQDVPATQAVAYFGPQQPGRVALVLGAGNVGSIVFCDILYKLFVENMVVVLKTNPVNDYIGPFIAESFRELVARGFLRVAYGGAAEGAYLCNHPAVDEVHITGSDKTFDAIVFGAGAAGAQRKRARSPLLQKPISGELGNVGPVIVVPGPWSKADIAYQAEQIASAFVRNAAFTCLTPRMIVQQQGWPQRAALLRAFNRRLAALPPRHAYYPGAAQRHATFTAAHPDARQIGQAEAGQLPWTLVAGLDPRRADEVCFSSEAFCSLIGETALAAPDAASFITQAVEFANDRIWGSLAATILVHPASLRDPKVAAALEQGIAALRYGSITVNLDPGAGFALTAGTWGAFPGNNIYAIGSGSGVVHNALMFSRAQKTVISGPFRAWPKPAWFISRAHAGVAAVPQLIGMLADPSPRWLSGLALFAIRP